MKNKQFMESIFLELAKGNDKPFIEAWAEDIQWTWMGTGQWSKTFNGKPAVSNELRASVKATITQPFKIVAHRFISEGDCVVVEASGYNNNTPDGKIYNNKYCWVCRIVNGKIRELNEYMDTELITKTFES